MPHGIAGIDGIDGNIGVLESVKLQIPLEEGKFESHSLRQY